MVLVGGALIYHSWLNVHLLPVGVFHKHSLLCIYWIWVNDDLFFGHSTLISLIISLCLVRSSLWGRWLVIDLDGQRRIRDLQVTQLALGLWEYGLVFTASMISYLVLSALYLPRTWLLNRIEICIDRVDSDWAEVRQTFLFLQSIDIKWLHDVVIADVSSHHHVHRWLR